MPTCQICQKEFQKLSKEHNPPKAIGNIGERKLFNPVKWKKPKYFQNGIHFLTTCLSCNNLQANYYVKPLKKFIDGLESLSSSHKTFIVHNPILVYKAILYIFCAEEGRKSIKYDPLISEFLLNPELKREFDFKICIKKNNQKSILQSYEHKMMDVRKDDILSTLKNLNKLNLDLVKDIENFKLLLLTNRDNMNSTMLDISSFSNLSVKEIAIDLPKYFIQS